jgi:hypothetical protein
MARGTNPGEAKTNDGSTFAFSREDVKKESFPDPELQLSG